MLCNFIGQQFYLQIQSVQSGEEGKERDKERHQTEKDKRLKDRKTSLDSGAEGYPAWAPLPLMFSFLRSSQISRAEESAWFGSIQSSNPEPPANRVQKESRWIETLKPSAKLMRSKHDGDHTQGFYATVILLLFCCPDLKRIGCNQQLAHIQHRIKKDSSKG